jgi:hypothetical protein
VPDLSNGPEGREPLEQTCSRTVADDDIAVDSLETRSNCALRDLERSERHDRATLADDLVEKGLKLIGHGLGFGDFEHLDADVWHAPNATSPLGTWPR